MIRTQMMARWLLVVAGIGLTPHGVFAQPQEKPPLPDYLAASIPDAIERGKSFLLRTQRSGTWSDGGNKVGYAALPALALLECGVSPNDPSIQAAANFVRSQVPLKEFINTYEVSLALLFLDRLGNKADTPYIQILAGRLVASQTYTGGWGYRVQYLDLKQTKEILGILKQLEPAPLEHMLAGRVPNMDNPFVKRAPIPDWQRKRTYAFPKNLQYLQPLPCFTQFGTAKMVDPKAPGQAAFVDPTDNSTTQFALLALWAARRHEIPCTRTGTMTFLRFHTSQNPDGSWGYPYGFGGSGGSPSMINTGLLGMAVGHGLVKEMGLPDDPPVDEDPRILNGFKALSAHVGMPMDTVKDVPYPNMYFLWSLERVCMLYDIHTIGNKDWYRWGAEALVSNQDPENGGWFNKDSYPGAAPPIDTSFALMFLKRANLAKDLSAYLAFSPKKLNEGVVKLAPPPPPVVPPQVKPEPARIVDIKPEPPPVEQKPVEVAEAKPAQPATPKMAPMQPPAAQPAVGPAPAPSGGMPWWIWLVIGMGGLLIVGGALFFFLFSGSSASKEEDEYDDEEDERPRKKGKQPRRR